VLGYQHGPTHHVDASAPAARSQAVVAEEEQRRSLRLACVGLGYE